MRHTLCAKVGTVLVILQCCLCCYVCTLFTGLKWVRHTLEKGDVLPCTNQDLTIFDLLNSRDGFLVVFSKLLLGCLFSNDYLMLYGKIC